jgi:CRISPR-associated Csx2 family protein
MAQTVLVSFIGTGQTPRDEKQEVLPKSRGKYLLANYRFHHNEQIIEKQTTVFGSALLDFLVNQERRKVSKWLLMGTPQSNWCDLIEAFPKETQDEIIENNLTLWSKLDDEAKRRNQSEISPSDLSEWSDVLTQYSKKTEIICRLVGTAVKSDSQNLIIESLLDVVHSGSEVIFDVTHGLRNQPIISTFALMYLKNIRNITNLDFYYGAFELGGEVVKLDVCNEIIKAIEAAAIFKQTGNYRQIGNQLDISESFKSRLDYVAYTDETLKPRQDKAKILLTESKKATNNPIKSSLSEKFAEALDWANEPSSALVWKKKAEMAFEREQYFKAIALLWESVLIAECERIGVVDSSKQSEREKADERLKKRMKTSNFWNLKNLRNSILHGTTPDSRDVKVLKAIDSLKDFTNIFDEGKKLFDEILSNQI